MASSKKIVVPAEAGTAKRIAGQHLRDLHDLLLVDHDAVGLLQDPLDLRVQGVGLLLALCDRDVARGRGWVVPRGGRHVCRVTAFANHMV